jgi:protein TonB
VAVHAALGWAFMTEQEVAIESGAGAQEVRVGTSFADMAVGTLEAVETVEMAKMVEPQMPDTVQPDTAEPVEVTLAQQVATPAANVVPIPIEAPVVAAQLADDAVPTIAALTPLKLAEPVTSETPPGAVTADDAQEVVEADDTVDPAVTRSLRPKRRSEAFEEKNVQIVKLAAPRQPKQPEKTPRGNAEQTQQAGADSGTASATATVTGTARGSSAASGDAAISNYPGVVMQRISRVPRPKAGSRGTAVVAFSISSGGGLAGASIARSSGSAALDRAAVRMIRSAAPFPPPPPGAQRSFSINVEGR